MAPTDHQPEVPDFPPVAGSTPAAGGPTPPRRRRPFRVLAVALLIALLGFAGGIAGFLVADEVAGDQSTRAADASDEGFQPTNDDGPVELDAAPVTDPSSTTMTPREIYRTVSPSVVHITSRATAVETGLFGLPKQEQSEGTGSGFVIDRRGHIVTNAHVVQGAEELSVSFGTEATDVPAKLVGADRSSDIAVIKVDLEAEQLEDVDLKPLRFGDSSKLQVGDPVLAIGNPFGLDRTLTTGVVSALQREIPALNDFRISDVIQTDAAVNPGNSGGPLLDGNGRVIGVNSQIQSRTGSFAGIAFAVPSSTVRSVANELVDKGKVEYAWLGVAGGEITPMLVKEYDLPVDEGVLVGSVTPGSPADKAGLSGGREVRELGTGETRREGGDVILRFDGTKLASMRQLADLVDAHKPGDEVRIEYLHNGRKRVETVTLGERPDDADATDE